MVGVFSSSWRGKRAAPAQQACHPRTQGCKQVQSWTQVSFPLVARQHFTPKSCQHSAGTKSPNNSEGLEEALSLLTSLPPSQLLIEFYILLVGNELVSLISPNTCWYTSICSYTPPLLAAHTTAVPSDIPAHQLCFRHLVSNGPFTTAATPRSARVSCTSPQVLQWSLMPSH